MKLTTDKFYVNTCDSTTPLFDSLDTAQTIVKLWKNDLAYLFQTKNDNSYKWIQIKTKNEFGTTVIAHYTLNENFDWV